MLADDALSTKRVKEKYYDTKTGKWTNVYEDTTDTNKDSTSTSTTESTTIGSGGSNSSGSVEKQYNEIQINTLQGSLSFIANTETIKLKAGDTVALKGLGKYLSGNYYVQDITKSVGYNGYEHTATLIKTDMGNSLKSTTTNKVIKEEKTVASTPDSNSSQRTYTVKAGDCLWNIAKKYYGNGKLYTKIYDANTDKIANPNLIYVGQVLVIP